MKKLLVMAAVVVTFFSLTAVSAGAVVDGVIKVGLRYGSSAMFSANLENDVGSGYDFGYYDDSRQFQSLGWTEETAISMTAAGTVYVADDGTYSASGSGVVLGPWHVELAGYQSYEDAAADARSYDGYPAWIGGEYVVRVGAYTSRSDAENAAGWMGGSVVSSSDTGVLVTVTGTTEVLFEYDDGGYTHLGVLPAGRDTATWFRGYRYPGGFEYRNGGGSLTVINVTDLEDYVKGVIPYEMSSDWPLAALEAQAICARTYACRDSKHLSTYGFDVCNTTDCQVYYGRGSGTSYATSLTDQAVDNTAGLMLYYQGELVQEAVYHASNGGATEDAENVWGGDVPYLVGKEDPYEAQTSIPGYAYTVTYTWEELTWVLQNSGYSIGDVVDAYVSEYTAVGNVRAVTFVDSSGGTLTVTGERARLAFYSSTLSKSVPSLRFTISGGTGGDGALAVNGDGTTLSTLEGISVISGSGAVSTLGENVATAISASGVSTVSASSGSGNTASEDGITITGTGSGHNVGLSQYGAKAMAEQGYSYQEILQFYYTDVTIE